MKKLNKLRLPLLLCLAFLDTYQVVAQTRLGLNTTLEELVIWRKRAGVTPGFTLKYVAKGDVQTNSPADWQRIVTNANEFKTNAVTTTKFNNVFLTAQQADYYYNVSTGLSTLVPQDLSGAHDPTIAAEKMRDAAFYFLLTGDVSYATPCRTMLLQAARDPLLQFSNQTRWKPGFLGSVNPGFFIAEWLNREMLAYDYLVNCGGYTGFSSGEKTEITTWLKNGAYYIKTLYDMGINGYFVDRVNGNYTISGSTSSPSSIAGLEFNGTDKSITYVDGTGTIHYERKVQKGFSNRHGSSAAFVTMAGILLNDGVLIKSGKQYYKDQLGWGYTPDMVYVDYSRQPPSEKGHNYSYLESMWPAIDALARIGDTELYDYSTKNGTSASLSGTEATTDGTTYKSYEKAAKLQLDQRYHRISPKMYGTEIPSQATGANKVRWEIDGVERDPNTGAIVHETVYDVTFANLSHYLWHKKADFTVHDDYMRISSGASPYAANPQGSGASSPWTLHYFPGVMFQYGDMETLVNEFPTLQGTPPTKKDQTITFNALPGKTFGDASFSLTAIAGSALTVSYTSSNTAVATISSNTVTVVGAGQTTITASQVGNGSFNAAPDKTQILTVGQASQTITFPTIADRIITAGKFRLPTSTSTSGGTVTFAVTAGQAYISNSDTLNPSSGNAVGAVTVTASQSGGANYLPAQPVSRTFSFTPASPPSVTDLLAGITVLDTTRYINVGTSSQQLESTLWFVLPSTHTGYSPKKLTIPSGFGVPDNTLGIIKMYTVDGSGVVTEVATFDATAQPIFEAPISFTGNIRKVYFRSLGRNIPMRLPAGSTGIKLEGL